MNGRQWVVLVLGFMVVIAVLGTGLMCQSPAPVSVIQGAVYVNVGALAVPPWAAWGALALLVFTGAAVYLSRTQGAA